MSHGDGAENITMTTVTMSGTAKTLHSLTSVVVLVIDSIGDAVYFCSNDVVLRRIYDLDFCALHSLKARRQITAPTPPRAVVPRPRYGSAGAATACCCIENGNVSR